MSIQDKIVIVTGAGSGIGRACAIYLASRGAKVVVGGRREDRIADVAAEITAVGGTALHRGANVTRREDVASLVDFGVESFGRVDVFVNNAGIGPISRFDALRVSDWDAMIDVNLRGVLHGVAAVLPHFERQQSGHVINVVSTSGLSIVPAMGVYAATKNAVRTVTEALRQEAGSGFRVTEISPGFVTTDFTDSMTDADIKASIRKQSDEMGMPPDAIARAVAFAIDQPEDVEVGSIVVRPTAQD